MEDSPVQKPRAGAGSGGGRAASSRAASSPFSPPGQLRKGRFPGPALSNSRRASTTLYLTHIKDTQVQLCPVRVLPTTAQATRMPRVPQTATEQHMDHAATGPFPHCRDEHHM